MPNFRITLNTKDGSGVNRASRVYGYTDPDGGLNDFVGSAYRLAGLIHPLVSGEITSVEASLLVGLDSSVSAPALTGSDCENVGLYSFSGFDTFPQAVCSPLYLYAANPDKYSNKVLIDTDADVIAFLAAITGGEDNLHFFDSRGIGYAAFSGGRLTMHKNRRNVRNRR